MESFRMTCHVFMVVPSATFPTKPQHVLNIFRYLRKTSLNCRMQGEFEDMVRRSIDYIKAGDVFQVVPSQRLSRHVNAAPFTIYRALRAINPSPYMFYLDMHDFYIVGASPELLVRYEDNEVTIRPIAGT